MILWRLDFDVRSRLFHREVLDYLYLYFSLDSRSLFGVQI
jgi:hypothetical protein